MMRLLFAVFILMVYVYVPLVLVFLFDDWTTIAPAPAAALGVLGVGTFLAARWATRRPAKAENVAAALVEYRTRMFVAIAFAESTALTGFALAFFGDSGAAYALGAILAIPAFVMAAPMVPGVARPADFPRAADTFPVRSSSDRVARWATVSLPARAESSSTSSDENGACLPDVMTCLAGSDGVTVRLPIARSTSIPSVEGSTSHD